MAAATTRYCRGNACDSNGCAVYFFTSRYVYSTLSGVSFLYGPSSDMRRPPKEMYVFLQAC